jgi:ABC-type glycerol-3-phosphate transport system permease component
MIPSGQTKDCNFIKKGVMRGNSNTFMYVVAGIIMLHFLVGFVWLIIKLSKKNEDNKE